MAPKKGGRGQKMSLAQFTGPTEDHSLDWAISHPSEDSGAVLAGDVGKKGAAPVERRDFSVKPGEIKNFRDLPQERSDKYVDPHMKPPFTSYVSNLPFGIDPESLKQQLEMETGPETIKNVRIVMKGAALVEFTSVDALHLGVMTSGKNIRGRTIQVGVASEEQKSMTEGGAGGRTGGRGGDRPQRNNGGAAAADGGAFALGRDSMGAQQPSFNSRGTDRSEGTGSGSDRTLSRDLIGSSQQTGGNGHFPSHVELGDDARTSLFGSVQQKRSPVSHGGPAGSPTAPGAAGGFGDWRNTEAVKQPERGTSAASPAPAAGGSGPRTPASATPAAGGGSWRASGSDGGSWRDSAPTPQPQTRPPRERDTTAAKPAGSPTTAQAPPAAPSGGATSWRDTAPEVPKAVLKKK